MRPSVPPPSRDCTGAARNAGAPNAPLSIPVTAQPLFPPKGADPEARRRWLASSPWPEVVFAAAV